MSGASSDLKGDRTEHGKSSNNDYNFCFPIDIAKLHTERMRLVPFDSDITRFSNLYVSLTTTPAAVSNFDHLPYGPFANQKEFLQWYNHVINPSDAVIWFAILVNQAGIDSIKQTKSDADAQTWEENIKSAAVPGDEYYAGTIGYLNASAENANVEIGHINIIPLFQRTFATTHANSVLLNYALEPTSSGCLQVRRAVWLCNSLNKRSKAAAERLGFKFEGVIRWHRVLPEYKLGPRVDGDGRGPGRDTVMLSICWDDWRDGVRERIRELLAR